MSAASASSKGEASAAEPLITEQMDLVFKLVEEEKDPEPEQDLDPARGGPTPGLIVANGRGEDRGGPPSWKRGHPTARAPGAGAGLPRDECMYVCMYVCRYV